MKKTTNLLLLFFIVNFTVAAQDYRFGKVSKEELEETTCSIDSSASAAYLYKARKSYIDYTQSQGFKLITEIHERVKIYDAKGFKYATKVINLYKDGSDKESFSGFKAYTYTLENNNVVEKKLKNDGIFEEETSKFIIQTKFTMPNISEGCILEYKYRIESPFVTNVDEFELQADIPVKKLESSFESPEYFVFQKTLKGYLPVSPKVETNRGRITFNSKSRSGVHVTKTNFSQETIEYVATKNIFDLENIPALRDEPFVGNIKNYGSAIKFELSYTKFPNEPIKSFTTTWEDVVKIIYKSENFGGELQKTGYFEEDIDQLINGVGTDLDKVYKVFGYVKDKVNWDGYYGKYTDKGVRKAYKEHVGNVAEINLMLTSMLRYAGLESYPVLVSTRSNGIPLFPTREGYNYVISSVKVDNGFILLDATSKYSTPNVLPVRTLNWEGRIIRKDGSSMTVGLYPSIKAKSNVSVMVTLNNEGAIDGSIRTVSSNHQALQYREKYIGANVDEFIQSKENRYDGMEIDGFEVSNDLDFSKPIMETFSFHKDSQAEVIGDKIYFSPLFFMRDLENPFKLDKREFPIDFGYPSGSKYMVNVVIPEGYEVESIPESVAFSLPDNLGSFTFKISKGANSSIQLVMESDINSSLIPAIYYDAIKVFYQEMIDKENEKVVLKKV